MGRFLKISLSLDSICKKSQFLLIMCLRSRRVLLEVTIKDISSLLSVSFFIQNFIPANSNSFVLVRHGFSCAITSVPVYEIIKRGFLGIDYQWSLIVYKHISNAPYSAQYTMIGKNWLKRMLYFALATYCQNIGNRYNLLVTISCC